MRRVGRQRNGFQTFVLDGPPLTNLAESFTFSIQGLDDRLSDFRIEAVEPPAITEMMVSVRYPEYLRQLSVVSGDSDEIDLQTPYQAGLRISEGSEVMLDLRASSPLGQLDAVLEVDGQERLVENTEFANDRMNARIRLENLRRATAIRLVPADENGIAAQAPYRYFLGAVMDETSLG